MVRFAISATVLAMAVGARAVSLHERSDNAATDAEKVTNFAKYVKNFDGALKMEPNASKAGKGSRRASRSGTDTALSDIQGTYGVILKEGINQGFAVGVLDYDGAGSMSGSLKFNVPRNLFPRSDTFGEDNAGRTFTTAVSGTYELEDNENGLRLQEWTYAESPVGPLTLESTLSLGRLQGGVASEVDGTLNVPSQFFEGGHVSYTMYRRPASGYSPSSLEGVWKFNGLAQGSGEESAISGRVTLLPDGTIEGFVNINDPAITNFEEFAHPGPDGNVRTIFPSPLLGIWSVNDNGTGSMRFDNQFFIAMGTDVMVPVDFTITEVVGNNQVVTVEGRGSGVLLIGSGVLRVTMSRVS